MIKNYLTECFQLANMYVENKKKDIKMQKKTKIKIQRKITLHDTLENQITLLSLSFIKYTRLYLKYIKCAYTH